MNKMKWDHIKFMKFCYYLNLPFPKTYVFTLGWKMPCVNYHNMMNKKIWDDLRIKHNGINPFCIDYDKALLASEAETAACVHVLRTMVEIILQIINYSLLKSHFHQSKVTLYVIKKELKKDAQMSELLKKIEQLEQSSEFTYIRDLDNTLKHQILVDTSYYHRYDNEDLEYGLRFKEFDYEYKTKSEKITKNHHPPVFAIDITEKYRKKIFTYIFDIGCAINKYLKNQKKKSHKKPAVYLLKSPIFN